MNDIIVKDRIVRNYLAVMALTSVSRPNKRSCSWLVQNNIASQLSPLFLYDASVPESIRDENGKNATEAGFTGNIRQWRDLSGSTRHLNGRGTFNANNNIRYSPNTNSSFPYNARAIATAENRNFGKNGARRLQRNLTTPIVNKSFECFLVGGFNRNPSNYSSFFSTGTLANKQPGSFQIYNINNTLNISAVNGGQFQLDSTRLGLLNYHIKYAFENNKTCTVYINSNKVAEQSNVILSFYQFRLFCNRNADVPAPADIQYLAIFDGLLTSEESKNYSLYQNCKWSNK